MRRSVLGVALLLGGLLAWTAGEGTESGQAIMQKQHDLHRLRDAYEVLAMRIFNLSGQVKERRLANYVLTPPDKLSRTLMRFLAPRDVENTALLTWERQDGDDDQWLYLPATRKAKRIASSGKKNRFMGSDFAYEDLRPENLALHTYRLVGREPVDGQPCFVIDAVPANERHAADSGYSRRRLWVREDIYLTVKQEYVDKRGRLEKIAFGRRFVNVKASAWRADELEMQDVQAGTRTVLVAERRAVDQGLDDSFFTQAELTRGRH
jgi:hypothetical protein